MSLFRLFKVSRGQKKKKRLPEGLCNHTNTDLFCETEIFKTRISFRSPLSGSGLKIHAMMVRVGGGVTVTVVVGVRAGRGPSQTTLDAGPGLARL